jgi:hypothetical protein
VTTPESERTRNLRRRGRVEGLLVKARGDGSPILLVQVGLKNDKWWSQYHQGILYLHGLADTRDNPVLYAVVTLADPNPGRKNARTESAEPAAAKAGGGFAARLGVFVTAAPGPDEPPGAALVWHGRAGSAGQLSRQLGRVVRAARLVPGWIGASERAAAAAGWRHERLGPVCCKLFRGDGSQVRAAVPRALVSEARATPGVDRGREAYLFFISGVHCHPL